MLEPNTQYFTTPPFEGGSKLLLQRDVPTLSVAIKDKNILYATYMGFVKPEGGLFIPTEEEFNPGDKVSLLLDIIDEVKEFEITGRVIWLTPNSVHGAMAPGIGVQFEGSKAKELNTRIKQILALDLQSELATYTM